MLAMWAVVCSPLAHDHTSNGSAAPWARLASTVSDGELLMRLAGLTVRATVVSYACALVADSFFKHILNSLVQHFYLV